MNIEQRSNQATDCCITEVHMESRLQKNLRVLRALRGVTPEMIFLAPRRTRSMNIERRSHQAAGYIAEVQMKPDRGTPRTTSKNLRALRDLRGVTPEMILSAPRRTRRARSMVGEQRSYQAAGCAIRVHLEPGGGSPETYRKNLRVLRALRGANSPFLSGPKHGF